MAHCTLELFECHKHLPFKFYSNISCRVTNNIQAIVSVKNH